MNWQHELALLRKDLDAAVALLRKDMELISERLERKISDGANRLETRLDRRINRAKIQTITWLVGTVLVAQVAAHFWH